MNIQKKLLIVLLILYPFGEFLRFDIGNHIVIKPIDFLAGLIVFIWLIINVQKIPLIIKREWYLYSFPIIAVVSLIFNFYWLTPQEFIVSAFYLVRWISYFILIFVIFDTDRGFKKQLNKLMLIGGAVIVAAGYLQYFFYNSLKPLWYLGWDDHLNRMFTVFFDPNYAGSFFVLYLIFLAGNLTYEIKNNNYNSLFSKKSVLLLMALVAVTLGALALTFSRSAILMFAASTILFFIQINMKKFVAFSLGLIVIYVILISPKFYDENMNLFRVASSLARIANYEKALIIIRDHPVIGVGFNTYRYTKELYGFDYGWVKAPSHSDAGVENSFLFVTATTGGIGFLSYLLLWYKLVIKPKSEQYKKTDFQIAVIRASAGGLFVNALFINSLFYAPIMLWMWLLIGTRYKE